MNDEGSAPERLRSPPGGEGAPWWLAVLATLAAVFLAVATIGGLAASRAAAELRPRLGGAMTVVVHGKGLESADAAAARAQEVIAAVSGVVGATPLEPDDHDAAIATLIAGRTESGEARLISVDTARSGGPSATALGAKLREARIDSRIDDHRGTGGQLERASLRLIAGAAITLAVALILIVAAAFAAAGAMIRRDHDRFDLMRRLGAREGFSAGVARRRVTLTVFIGAVGGLFVGIIAAVALGGRAATTLAISIEPFDALAAVIWPFVLAGAAALASEVGARGELRRLETRG